MTSETLGGAASLKLTAERRVPEARVTTGSIRVLDVCNLDSSANTILKQRVLAMRSQGIDNRIACVDGPYVRLLEDEGIPIFTLPMPRGFDLLRVAVCFFRMFHYLRREKIDLVHTHFSVPGFIGRAAARLAGVPVIVHTIHGLPYHAKSSALQRGFYVLLERSVGKLADVVLSQNRGNIDDAIRWKIVPRERLRFIGNGICIDRFRPPRRDAAPEPVTITCLARLETVKHHTMLFEAVRRLQGQGLEFRVRLVGGGDLGPEYQTLCERLGIRSRVEFLGYRDDVPEILATSDISVLTSIKEGVPRALLESMAMALPVVATRIPGNIDAVRDQETGFLVEVDDVDALTDRLARLIQDHELRARLGARGREVAIEEFDEDRIIESLSHVYKTLLLKKGVVAPVPIAQTVSP